jgi:hypothetical protein
MPLGGHRSAVSASLKELHSGATVVRNIVSTSSNGMSIMGRWDLLGSASMALPSSWPMKLSNRASDFASVRACAMFFPDPRVRLAFKRRRIEAHLKRSSRFDFGLGKSRIVSVLSRDYAGRGGLSTNVPKPSHSVDQEGGPNVLGPIVGLEADECQSRWAISATPTNSRTVLTEDVNRFWFRNELQRTVGDACSKGQCCKSTKLVHQC